MSRKPEDATCLICPILSTTLEWHNCIAAKCMFWEWDKVQEYQGPTKTLETGYCRYAEK